MHPENLHFIDRLAVALTEAESAGFRDAGRYKALLLHHALLKGQIQHPLQRPMHLVRGLESRPFWVKPVPSGGGIPVALKGLEVLLDIASMRAMQEELGLESILGDDEAYHPHDPDLYPDVFESIF